MPFHIVKIHLLLSVHLRESTLMCALLEFCFFKGSGGMNFRYDQTELRLDIAGR